MKKMLSALAALVIVGSASACGTPSNQTDTVNFNLECDAGDYVEHDTDCGWNNDRNWEYYYWTKQGETTHSPDGWYPPEEVAHTYVEEEEPAHKAPKVKKTKNSTKKPATNSYKAPAVVNKPAAPVKVNSAPKSGRK